MSTSAAAQTIHNFTLADLYKAQEPKLTHREMHEAEWIARQNARAAAHECRD